MTASPEAVQVAKFLNVLHACNKTSSLLIFDITLQVMINVLTRLHLTCMNYAFLLVERQLARVLDFNKLAILMRAE